MNTKCREFSPQIRLRTLASLLLLALILSGPAASGQSREASTGIQAGLAELDKINDQIVHLYERGDYAEAIPLAELVLTLREQALGPDHPDVAQSAHNLASQHKELGAYAQAEPLYVRALRIYEKSLGPNHSSLVMTLNNLAELKVAQGAFQDAELLFERALRISEKSNGAESADTGTVIANVASLHRELGQYVSAAALLNRAQLILQSTLGREHVAVAKFFNTLGALYQDQGLYDEAEYNYERARHIFERNFGREHMLVALSLNNLAVLYANSERAARAEGMFKQALVIHEKTLGKDHPITVTDLNNLGGLYMDQGAHDQAIQFHERALSARRRMFGDSHPDVAQSLNNLGMAYRSQGNREEAGRLFKDSLMAYESSVGAGHGNVAMVLGNLADYYESNGDLDRARTCHLRQFAIRERHASRELLGATERGKRNLIQMRVGETAAAVSFQVHAMPNDDEALRLAFAVALERKGRVLDELAGARQALRRNLTPGLQIEFDELRTKQAELALLREAAPIERAEAVRALEGEVDRRESELGRKSSAFRARTAPVTPEQVRAELPEGAVLVEFVRYQRYDAKSSDPWKEARYVAYLLRHKGVIQWVPLGEAEPIEKAVQAARRSLTERASDVNGFPTVPVNDAHLALRKLDAFLLAPIRNVLGDVPHLLLSPDGALHTVPFEALVDEQGHYLVEHSSVTYLGSGRDLLRMGERLSPRSGPLVLAAPDFGPGDQPFAPLRGAMAEGEAVRKLFPEARILPGAAATREALLGVHGPRFALLSTHGFLRHPGLSVDSAPSAVAPVALSSFATKGTSVHSTLPPDEAVGPERALERAGLALAGANQRADGIVSGRDLAGLDLGGTKLVVLSACETGLGQLADGEGAYGLRRALAIAGAESQVVSLWNVNDAATGELIGAYFRGLKDGAGRSEALRQAQLGMLRQDKYKHPYYWAAFVPAGDWRPLDGGGEVPRVPPGGTCGCRVAGGHAIASWGTAITLALLGSVGRARRRLRPAERLDKGAARRGGADEDAG
jgi:CHAT domain-containing protein